MLASLFVGDARTTANPAPVLSVDQLVGIGRYSQIPTPKDNDSHGHAVWAFARYHLAPTKAVVGSAQAAHKQGEDLGTFVLMLCHRTGSGVVRDRALAQRLNFELRTKLERKKDPSPLDLYMLSQCHSADATGRTTNKDAEKLFEELNRQRKLAWQRLKKAAELEFAQACQDVALAQEDPAEAHKWHRKAAELGLAEGMRYTGLQLVVGAGVEKDAAKGLALSEKAANQGDVYAMINLVVFYDQGLGVKKDPQKAQQWLDAASKSGHWYGFIEQGMALLGGHYSTKVDRKQGMEILQKAVETGNADALTFVASAYAKGFGLKRDGKQAVRFAEAGYRQGNAKAAAVLASIYGDGLGEVKADEELASFWGREARKPGFGVDLLPEQARTDFFQRLDAIDPLKLKVE
jgi:TPR repeat protein